MTTQILLMCAINATLVVIMVPRIYGDWVRFNDYCREREHERLKGLLQVENQWVMRHIFCAFAAFIMIVAIKRYPYLDRYDQLSNVMVVYAMLSLMFAFAESLFALKISNDTASD